jgi:radical SAM superfamily enzyme YgiQ (UPF0313 family)
LKEINKDLNIKKMEENILLCKDLDIKIHLTFSIGYISDTFEGISETFEWLLKQNPDFMQLSIATPFPGTKMYELYKPEEDYSKFDGNRFCITKGAIELEKVEKIKENWYKLWNEFKRSCLCCSNRRIVYKYVKKFRATTADAHL